MEFFTDTQNRVSNSPYGRTGFINVPLTNLREVFSNTMTNIAGNGGVLASDTTPTFTYTNGDTDSALRVGWASSNSDQVAFQVTCPPDMDTSNPILIKTYMAMAGATDTPTVSWETHFNKGGTKRTAVTAAVTGTTEAIYTATITAAAGAPTRPVTMSCEATLGAHTTDIAYLYAVWLEYTRL